MKRNPKHGNHLKLKVLQYGNMQLLREVTK